MLQMKSTHNVSNNLVSTKGALLCNNHKVSNLIFPFNYVSRIREKIPARNSRKSLIC